MKTFFLSILLFTAILSHSQVQFSLGTDVSLLRNFSANQQFTAFGQSVQGNVHFNERYSAYAWLSYYLPAGFTNSFTATARTSTTPATVHYRVKGEWKYNQVSIGLKPYLYGSFNSEERVSIYGIAGFGLLFAKATNTQLDAVDTALYNKPATPQIGSSSFKRLTLDLGLGADYPLGAGFYIYGDLRTWIATSNYPSAIYHNTDKAPVPVMASVGLRVLFGQ